MSQIVADRYAEALFAIATQTESLVDKIDHDLTLVTQTVVENPGLRELLEHPLVRREDKKQIVRDLFGPHVAPTTLNFLQLLFDRGRGSALEMIQSRFHHLASKLARRLTVQLTTAVPIAAEQLQQFREQLEEAWKRQIELEAQVDAELLGGAVMRVEDQVIDGSLRGRLDALQRAMVQSER
ncbi:MAG: ATP synthase F1 subunit delta [Cyanobacteria bacterium REEB65]|nr:ATP synthase F1 subunit delta [Cyanobacteria bacterium REEB65]